MLLIFLPVPYLSPFRLVRILFHNNIPSAFLSSVSVLFPSVSDKETICNPLHCLYRHNEFIPAYNLLFLVNKSYYFLIFLSFYNIKCFSICQQNKNFLQHLLQNIQKQNLPDSVKTKEKSPVSEPFSLIFSLICQTAVSKLKNSIPFIFIFSPQASRSHGPFLLHTPDALFLSSHQW